MSPEVTKKRSLLPITESMSQNAGVPTNASVGILQGVAVKRTVSTALPQFKPVGQAALSPLPVHLHQPARSVSSARASLLPSRPKTVESVLPVSYNRQPRYMSVWAKRLQEERALAKATPKIQCAVCLVDREGNSLPCAHRVCKPCLNEHIKMEFTHHRRPECMTCKELIPWKLLKEYADSSLEHFKQYCSYMSRKGCISPESSEASGKGNSSVISQWSQQLCQKEKVASSDAGLFSDRLLSGKWRVCNRCYTVIERQGGCKRMVCRRCYAAFCWVCNDRWQAGRHHLCDLKTMTTPRKICLPSFKPVEKK